MKKLLNVRDLFNIALALWVVIWGGIILIDDEIRFENSNYIGYVFVLVGVLMYVFNLPRKTTLVGIYLVLYMFNLVQINNVIHTTRITLVVPFPPFNPMGLLLLLIFLTINRKRLLVVLQKIYYFLTAQ